MDLSFMSEYLVLVVFGICLCVGFVIKTSFPSVDNKYIPLIMAILGIALNVWACGLKITPEIILAGMFSGLSSTGAHQLFKMLITKEGE